MAGGFALEFATLGGFTFALGVTECAGLSLIGHGLSVTLHHAQDISLQKSSNVSYGNNEIWTLDKRVSSDEPGSPPHRGDQLGNGTKSPDRGYEWKGSGTPGSSKGNWVRGNRKDTQEVLHPDLNHKPPIGPHWDYESPSFPKPGVRLYPDGTWEHK